MKNLFLIITLLLIGSVTSAQKKYTITGKISGLKDGTPVRILYQDGRPRTLTTISNGIFKVSGTITEPTYASVSLIPDWELNADGTLKGIFYQSFFLDTGETKITGTDFPNAIILGGPTQTEYRKSGLERLKLSKDSTMLTYGEASMAKVKDLNLISDLSEIHSIRKQLYRDAAIAFITSHNDSYISLKLLMDFSYMTKTGPDLYDPIFDSISLRLKNTLFGKKLEAQLRSRKQLVVGKIPPNFSQPDIEGNIVELSSLKGKYVLVEFWASWCKPCRVESPNLVEAYKEFKGKNFEILSISEDHSKENWKKAIKDDHLNWTHLSDLKGVENAAAKLWGVNGVPKNYLLNPNGVIIAVDLRGENLKLKLSELLL